MLAGQPGTESVIDPAMTQAAPSLSDQLRAQASSEQPIPFRQPPHNIDAEQALLGAILVNNEALDRVSGFLKPEHFYDPLHGQIFETIGQLIHLGKQATPITLRTFFENAEAIESNLTVPQYLGRLAVNATTIINCADYGRTIYDLSVRRQLITVGEDVVNAAFDSPVDSSPEKQIQEAEGRLYALAENGKYGKGFVTFGEALLQSVEMAGAAYERDGGLSGISTGLVDLDRQMGGLQRSDLIVLAGRPSMGKTALAINIAEHVALNEGLPVAVFSMEMGAAQLAVRVVGSIGRIDQSHLRTGKLTDDEWPRLSEAIERLRNVSLHIDESAGLNSAQLRANARRLARKCGKLGLIVVDYLQLMSGTDSDGENRATELGEISRGLKTLAKELQCPVIALSQLNRSVESRPDKRPMMSDLRESGAIEQDADIIMFIYRDEYYTKEASKDPGVAEIIIAKQRNGPTGTVKLAFLRNITKFESLAHGASSGDF